MMLELLHNPWVTFVSNLIICVSVSLMICKNKNLRKRNELLDIKNIALQRRIAVLEITAHKLGWTVESTPFGANVYKVKDNIVKFERKE